MFFDRRLPAPDGGEIDGREASLYYSLENFQFNGMPREKTSFSLFATRDGVQSIASSEERDPRESRHRRDIRPSGLAGVAQGSAPLLFGVVRGLEREARQPSTQGKGAQRGQTFLQLRAIGGKTIWGFPSYGGARRKPSDDAGIAQWQCTSFPNWLRGFDSRYPLFSINFASPVCRQAGKIYQHKIPRPWPGYFIRS